MPLKHLHVTVIRSMSIDLALHSALTAWDCCILLLSQGRFYEQAQVGAALWQLNLSQIAINGRLHHLLIHGQHQPWILEQKVCRVFCWGESLQLLKCKPDIGCEH